MPSPPAAAPDPDPVLPDRAADDSDQGWGETGSDGRGDGGRADDWYRRERPPHHGG